MRILIILILGCIFCLPLPTCARQSTQAAFSPSPDAIELITDTIGHAKSSVEVAAYSFTSLKVSDALIAAYGHGVAVRVVLDKSQARHHSRAAEALYAAGIPVRINRHYAIMHDKYLIIDGKTVETGSFNFTASAEHRNAENVVVIKNNKKLAQKFIENWQKLWGEGEEYQP